MKKRFYSYAVPIVLLVLVFVLYRVSFSGKGSEQESFVATASEVGSTPQAGGEKEDPKAPVEKLPKEDEQAKRAGLEELRTQYEAFNKVHAGLTVDEQLVQAGKEDNEGVIGYLLAYKRDSFHDMAYAYRELGGVYGDKRKYDEAIDCYTKALKGYRERFGEAHADVADCYFNLGIAYGHKGGYGEAIGCYECALRVYRASGIKYGRVATCYNNLGEVYEKKGDYDEAIDCYKEALNIYHKVYADSYIAYTCQRIANVYDDKGDYDRAISWKFKALNKYRWVHNGDQHADVADCYFNLGISYGHKGDYDEAIERYTEALSSYRAVYGDLHADVAVCYFNLGLAYGHKGDYDEAVDCLKKALVIYKEKGGLDDPRTKKVQEILAMVVSAKGK